MRLTYEEYCDLLGRYEQESDQKWKYIRECCNLNQQIKEKDAEIAKLKEGIEWRQDGIKDLEDEIDKKNEEIELLKAEKADLKETIKRMSQQLTEKELFEKKMKAAAPTGVPAIDAVMDRMCRLEAHIEAQENPYFF